MNEIQKQEVQPSFNFFDPKQFDTMQRLCKMFANSELVPEMYRAKITPIPANAKEPQIQAIQSENLMAQNKAMANCMIAIEIAQRIGASPLMIMQNMIIIYGRPSWSSKFLIATINTCGRFNSLQYRFVNQGRVGKVDYTDYEWNDRSHKKEAVRKEFDGTLIDNVQCIAFTTARGSADILESSPIDIKLAIQEGWYTKNGSKWQSMTKQMLMYRAASFWTNAYAPELSMGMKTEEELRDIIDLTDSEVEDITDKVEKEKTNNANKDVISFNNPEPQKKEDEKPTEMLKESTSADTGLKGNTKADDKLNPQIQF